MKRIIFMCVAVLLATDAFAAPRRRAVSPPRSVVDTRYLNAAIEVANRLDTLAIRRGDGLAWANEEGSSQPTPGLPGTSGVGLFYLRLFQVTREPRYLASAQAAATYAFAQHAVMQAEWQGGMTGVGELLVALYRVKKDESQLVRIRTVADAIIRKATTDGDAIYWPTPNNAIGIAHGNGGPALFLTHAYETTGDGRYLDAAEAAVRWMSRHTVPAGGGILFKQYTTDAHGALAWCGGSTGAIEVLRILERATGNVLYRQQIDATARGIAHEVRRDAQNGVIWRYFSANGPGTGEPYVYCHGSSSNMVAMEHAGRLTGNGEYRDIANAAAQHLIDAHATEPLWPHIRHTNIRQPGFMVGVASIGHGMLELWRSRREPRHLQAAVAAGDDLLRIANRPTPGQLRFINIVDGPADWLADAGYGIGWWDGASGIGIYLLELHDALRGIAPADDVTPISP